MTKSRRFGTDVVVVVFLDDSVSVEGSVFKALLFPLIEVVDEDRLLLFPKLNPLATGNTGVEFDGTYFYVTRAFSNLIHKYDIKCDNNTIRCMRSNIVLTGVSPVH